jgi:polyhydroxyalkanoate synthase
MNGAINAALNGLAMTDEVDRRGAPSPLILHLASALSLYETGARLAPLANQRRFPWAEPPDEAAKAVANATASAPRLTMALALRSESAGRLMAMTEGMRLYQQHTVRRDAPEQPVIWSDGAARLLDYGPADAPPVFVTPSLINRYYILDLDESASLIGALRAAGLRPLVLDWGAPGAAEQQFDLTDYTEKCLAPAFLAGLEMTGAHAMPIIGYCMGGTMSVALAQHLGGAVSRLALIGAPWDFSMMTPMRGALAAVGLNGRRHELEQALNIVAGTFGAVPVHMLQMIFALLDPGLAARKFRRFAALDQKGAEARRFVLIEDWLNDGPAFSGPAARESLIDWHAENQTLSGRWRVFGEQIKAETLSHPTLVIAATGDRIAPPAATTPLAQVISNARLIQPTTGHVGMIVGRSAPETVWRPLADFLNA